MRLIRWLFFLSIAGFFFIISGCAAFQDIIDSLDKTTDTPKTDQTQQTTLDLSTNNITFKDNSFQKYCLMALNINGSASGSKENIGSIPTLLTSQAPNTAKRLSTPKVAYKKDKRFFPKAPSTLGIQSLIRKKTLTHADTSHTFWGFDGNNAVTVNASLRYGSSSSTCLIYVQTNQATTANWTSIGNKFDDEIYPRVTAVFGVPSDVDQNGKVVLLYYNMPNDQNTSGFFFSGDLFVATNTYPNRNGMEIFHLNLSILAPDHEEMIRTIPHELQHIINYSQRTIINNRAEMVVWLDEGLAESAEHIALGTANSSRILTIQQDISNLIKNGHPLLVWLNTEEDYALSYTFLQYCRIQAKDGSGIYKAIIESDYSDYKSIEAIMKTQNTAFTDFKTLIISYRLANLLNKENSVYGYGLERTTFDFTSQVSPTSITNLSLQPGGSIYMFLSESNLTSFSPSGQGANIVFVRISK